MSLESFRQQFLLLGELCKVADVAAFNKADLSKCKGLEITWCMLDDGGGQYANLTGKRVYGGSVAVKGGCCEGSGRADTDRIIGQARAFVLLHSGWHPESPKFVKLMELAYASKSWGEWLEKIFDPLVTEELRIGDSGKGWPKVISAFDDEESNQTEYQITRSFRIFRGRSENAAKDEIRLATRTWATDLSGVDFDTVIA